MRNSESRRIRAALAVAVLLCAASATRVAAEGSAQMFERYSSAAKRARKANDCEAAKKNWTLAADEAAKFPTGDARLVTALTGLGLVEDNQHDFGAAEDAYKRALPAVTVLKQKHPLEVGTFWRNYARLLGRMDNNEMAAKLAETSLQALERGGDKVELGHIYNDLGNYYSFLHRDAEAEPLKIRAVEILRGAGDPSILSMACANLALYYSDDHKLNMAWGPYECAVAAARKAPGGLVSRDHKRMLQAYSEDLKTAGMSGQAAEMGRILARIDALPPDNPGDCNSGLTVTTAK